MSRCCITKCLSRYDLPLHAFHVIPNKRLINTCIPFIKNTHCTEEWMSIIIHSVIQDLKIVIHVFLLILPHQYENETEHWTK